jgi:hypothetical protein
MSLFAGPADLPFFDLLSIVGKLCAGFGAMGFSCKDSIFYFPIGLFHYLTVYRVVVWRVMCNALPLLGPLYVILVK